MSLPYAVDPTNGNIADEQMSTANDQEQLQVLQAVLDEKWAMEEACQEVKKVHNATQAALSNSEELLQSLLTGLSFSNTNNSGGGYMGQLADAKAHLAQGAVEEEQNHLKTLDK